MHYGFVQLPKMFRGVHYPASKNSALQELIFRVSLIIAWNDVQRTNWI
jgi:hypothetical protein